MSIIDMFDDLTGEFDLIDKIWAAIKYARRGGAVRYDHKRADKGGEYTGIEITEHLKKYGVDNHGMAYSSETLGYQVSGRQQKWHDWLVQYDGAGNPILRHPKRSWGDKPERSGRKRQRRERRRRR